MPGPKLHKQAAAGMTLYGVAPILHPDPAVWPTDEARHMQPMQVGLYATESVSVTGANASAGARGHSAIATSYGYVHPAGHL
jgi:hypothetical protein